METVNLKNQFYLSLSRKIPIHILRKIAATQVKLNPKEKNVLFCTPDRFHMSLDLSDVQGREIFLYGYTEINSVRWCKKLIKPGMIVCDIGSNIGQYSLLYAHLVGFQGKVHSFEPDPINFKLLQQNILLNPKLQNRIVVNPLGLGNQEEEVSLFVGPEGYLGMSSAVRKPSPESKSNLMKVITLDEYSKQKGISSYDFLKIDVEGYEMKVLQGAKKILAQKNPMAILCELNFLTLPFAKTTAEEILDFLFSYGFQAFSPRAFPLPLTRIEKLSPQFLDNVLFIRK